MELKKMNDRWRNYEIRRKNSRTGPSFWELGLAELPRLGSVRSLMFACFVCSTILLFLVCLRHFASRFCLYEGAIFLRTCLMMVYLYLMAASLLVELEKTSGSLRAE